MANARYVLRGEESESVLDCETGIIVVAVDRASAELMRDQLNSYEERLDAERAAHEATKARRALAEAVCRTLYACPYPPDGVVLDALEAWRAAK